MVSGATAPTPSRPRPGSPASALIVRPIAHGSADYAASLELRRRFLREPLGLELSAEDTAGEDAQRQFGAFDHDGRLLGSVIAKPIDAAGDAPCIRIRQMVVDADHRGAGVGRSLLLGAERQLAEQGVYESRLFARAEAMGFYRVCGYAATGVVAELIGMPHHEMRKSLRLSAP